jgi:hypothetical protein
MRKVGGRERRMGLRLRPLRTVKMTTQPARPPLRPRTCGACGTSPGAGLGWDRSLTGVGGGYRREAAARPNVVTVLPPATAAAVGPSRPLHRPLVPAGPACAPAPPGLGPSRAWAVSFVAAFAQLRQAAAGHTAQRTAAIHPPLPRRHDEAYVGPPPAFAHGGLLVRCCCACCRAWRARCYGDGAPGPTPALVAALSQPQTLELLQWHAELWLPADDVDAFTTAHAHWLFALLVQVDRLLTADATVTLRTLCRRCAHLRARLRDPADPRLPSLSMVVAIVSLYFEQHDLADTTVRAPA